MRGRIEGIALLSHQEPQDALRTGQDQADNCPAYGLP
jgi:hypothetical protein